MGSHCRTRSLQRQRSPQINGDTQRSGCVVAVAVAIVALVAAALVVPVVAVAAALVVLVVVVAITVVVLVAAAVVVLVVAAIVAVDGTDTASWISSTLSLSMVCVSHWSYSASIVGTSSAFSLPCWLPRGAGGDVNMDVDNDEDD